MSASIVQTSSMASSSGAATTTMTFASPTTAGNAVVALVNYGAATGPQPVPTASGFTFSFIVGLDAAFAPAMDMYLAQNIPGGTTAITANHGSSGDHYCQMVEIAGLVTSGTATDGTASSAVFRGTSFNAGTITPSSGHDLLMLSTAWDTRGDTFTVPSGYTSLANGNRIKIAYEIVTSPSGSYSPTWTAPTSYGDGVSVFAAFVIAGSPPPTANGGFFRFMH